MAVSVLVTIAGFSKLPCSAAEEPTAPAPGVLFHASFDAAGHDNLEPMVHPDGHAVLGEPGRFPNADFAAGNPVPSNVHRVEIVEDGKRGEAAFVPSGGILSFEAPGNILASQGTVAFWVKPEDALFSHPYRGANHPKILNITDGSFLGRGRAFLEINVNGPRENLMVTGVGHRVSLEEEWQPGQWTHLAVTWDETEGRHLYENGKLIAADKTFSHRFPSVDKINLASWVYIAWRSGARYMGFYYDDVYIFDYPLTGEQVHELAETGNPPASPPNRVLKDDERWQRWFDEIFVAADDVIPVLGREGLSLEWQRVNRIRSHYTDERLTVSVDTRLCMNGSPHTAINGERIDFHFQPGSRFNFVRAASNFSGILRADEDAIAVPLEVDGYLARLAFNEPVQAGLVSIDLNNGSINQVDFIDAQTLEGSPSPEKLTPPDHLWPVTEKGTGRASGKIQAYYPPGSRTLLAGSSDDDGERTGITLDRTFHIEFSEHDMDQTVSGLLLNLDLGPVQADTTLNIRLFDPARFNRYLCDVEVQVEASSEPQVLKLRLAGLDFLVRGSDPIWLALTPRNPLKLFVGNNATSVILLEGDEDARDYYIRSLERYISDIFKALSEPQPWRAAAERTNPPKQMLGVAKLYEYCDYLRHFDPDNKLANAIVSWSLTRSNRWLPEAREAHPDPLRDKKLEPVEGNGPRWAALGRQALAANRAIIDWWLDNRLDPETGMLGGGLGDDTTFMPWLVNLALISDPDDRYRNAVRLLADYTWETSLDRGLNIRMTDHLHAYEEGTNIQHLLPRLFYGEPEGIQRLLITSRFYDGHLTAINPQGLRLARAANFNAETPRAPEGSAWHSTQDLGQSMIYMPGRILTWYNGHPVVTKVLAEWVDTWLKYADRDASSAVNFIGRGGIDFYTGKRSGRNYPGEMWHHIYWAAEVTEDPKYLKPSYTLGGYGGVDWRLLAAESDPKGLGEGEEEAARATFRTSQQDLLEQLESDILFVEKYLPVQTSVGQSTDRVQIPQNAVARMYLGGLASIGKRLPYLYNAVSWEDADDEIVRYVVDKSRRSLKVLIYSYHDTPQDIILRPWQLRPGRYNIRTGIDTDGDEQPDSGLAQKQQDLWRYEAIPLTIPPGKVFVVEIEIEEPFDWKLHDQPDLGIGKQDVRIEDGDVVVTVHNLGSVETPATEVALYRGEEKIARQPIPAMEPPLDYVPRTHEIRFVDIGAAGGLTVVVAPGETFREITRVNNVVKLE